MKNANKYYGVAWGIAVVAFHIIMIAIPKTEIGLEKGSYWVIYLAVMVSLIGQAACTRIYTDKKTKEERFLYIPVVLISYIALLMTLLLSLEAVTLSFLPAWFTVIVALLVLCFYAFAVIRTMAAADMVMEIDKKVEQRTDFMRTLTAKASALTKTVPADRKKQAVKVYEALRYSDPVSCAELKEFDEKLDAAYQHFADVIRQGEDKNAETEADRVCAMVKERNELCRRYKK